MLISTKGRYAMCVMLDLAEHYQEGPVALKDISSRQNISKKYLEQIVALLNRPEILKTVRGAQGGYMLARPASEYSVHSILQVVEGSMAPVTCLQQAENTCERRDACRTLPLWQGLEKLIHNYLSGITLEDIVEGRIPDPTL